MNPLVGAGLTHPEQLALNDLQRVGLRVDQHEQQLVLDRPQAGLATSTGGTSALFRFGFDRRFRSRQSFGKDGKQFLKLATGQTGKRNEFLRLFLECLVG